QLWPNAELLVVTTPEHTAAQVAALARELSTQTEQPDAGVIENMGPMQLPDGTVIEVLDSGCGSAGSTRLSHVLDQPVHLLGSIPLDPVLRADSEPGTPCIIQSPTSAAGSALDEVVARLAGTPRGLAGKKLPVTPR